MVKHINGNYKYVNYEPSCRAARGPYSRVLCLIMSSYCSLKTNSKLVLHPSCTLKHYFNFAITRTIVNPFK